MKTKTKPEVFRIFKTILNIEKKLTFNWKDPQPMPKKIKQI